MRTTTLPIVLAAALAAPADDARRIDPVLIPAIIDLGNKTCPVSGDEIKGDDHVGWQCVRVRLCCPGCKPRFERAPGAALGRLGLKVVRDGDSVVIDLENATCAIMSKAAKRDIFADIGGMRLHVCCSRCQAKVTRAPSQAFKRLGYGYTPAVIDLRNTTCPMSGKPVADGKFADHDGIRVRFCCDDCPAAFAKDPAAVFAKMGVDPAKLKATVK
jgi:hypothetical protein